MIKIILYELVLLIKILYTFSERKENFFCKIVFQKTIENLRKNGKEKKNNYLVVWTRSMLLDRESVFFRKSYCGIL